MRNIFKISFLFVLLLIILWGAYGLWHAKYAVTPVPPTTSTQPYADEMVVVSPAPHEVVRSPIHIYGKARGTWYFEASFPVRLETQSGVVLATMPAQAQSDWMTTDFVPFDVTISFTVTSTMPAKLILRADNPSGLPQNEKSVTIPVVISP